MSGRRSAGTAGTAGRARRAAAPTAAESCRPHRRSRRPGRRRRRGCHSAAPSAVPSEEPEDQHGQHHRVVGAEQSFEGDEQGDGDEIGGWTSSTRPFSITARYRGSGQYPPRVSGATSDSELEVDEVRGPRVERRDGDRPYTPPARRERPAAAASPAAVRAATSQVQHHDRQQEQRGRQAPSSRAAQ